MFLRHAIVAVPLLLLAACGSTVSVSAGGGASSGGTSGGTTTGSTTGGSTTGGTTTGGTTTGGTTTGGTTGGSSGAAALAAKLGRPNRFLIGLGTGNEAGTIQSQGLHIDLYDRYLTDNSGGSWINYNSPPGAYVDIVAAAADSLGAVPMFTLYQMAVNGDGNLLTLSNQSQMQAYWQHTVLLFQRLAAYGKPALVNLEPDFWGYAEQQSGNDPTKLFAYVNITPECSTLPNNVAGVGACLVKIARTYAPKAYVGFPPSDFGNTTAEIIAFMNAVGAASADFIVMQTLDRDAGCFEKSPQPAYCARPGTGWYWDETNATHPNFQDHLAVASAWHAGIGNLPLVWWQTPQGVPAASALGGADNHYRDNRVHYFLTHASELTAAGGLGAVFGTGESHQTSIGTDGAQFQTLSNAYLANPAPLP